MATNNPINNESFPFQSASLTVDTGGGDAAVQYTINTVDKWILGCDDTDADVLVLSRGAAIGTNNVFRMTQTGNRTLPLQSAFHATSSGVQTNATGNGTPATVNFATIIYNQGTNYDGANTFTAPRDGKYLFTAVVEGTGITAAATRGTLQFITTLRTYTFFDVKIGNYKDTAGRAVYSGSIFTNMAVTDTCLVQFTVTGEGADIVDIGLNAESSYFSGQLIC